MIQAGYASVWKRLAAYLIDTLLLSIIGGIAWLLDLVSNLDDLLAFSPILLLFSWLYFAIMESSPLQATLGKKMLGLEVCNLEGEQISFLTATIRYFSKILSTLVLYAGYIMAFFTEKHQGLHDMIAKTVVIDTAAAPVSAYTNNVMLSQPAPPGETPLFSAQFYGRSCL